MQKKKQVRMAQRRRMNFQGVILIFTLLMVCCGEADDDMNSDIERRVLEQMLDIAELNSIMRYELDWSEVQQSVLNVFEDQGFNFGVRQLLKELGDNHSFYLSGSNQSLSNSAIRCSRTFNIPNMENDSIAYLDIKGFSGSQEEGLQFAKDIRTEIIRQDGPHIKGWVVDLSNNTGGNMYPMVSGLGPLLGDGVLGYFIDPDGESIPWGYRVDGSFVGTSKLFVLPESYTLRSPEAKIAAVVDNQTASSGEATLISFMAREDVLLIGKPSCGLSTANSGFNLRNGARFFLTVSTMADRNKTQFGGMIAPDIDSDDPIVISREIFKFFNQ